MKMTYICIDKNKYDLILLHFTTIQSVSQLLHIVFNVSGGERLEVRCYGDGPFIFVHFYDSVCLWYP